MHSAPPNPLEPTFERENKTELSITFMVFCDGCLVGGCSLELFLRTYARFQKEWFQHKCSLLTKLSQIYFFGAAVFCIVLCGLILGGEKSRFKKHVATYGIWFLMWCLLAYRLDSLQTPIVRWVFFTLPLAWFVARLWWGGLRKSPGGTARSAA